MCSLTLGSLFSGSGGFELAGLYAKITPIWSSEIEPFPIRVTTKKLPQVKHYGDISTLNGGMMEPVDIITFGSPCTNLSVAGKREGLDGKQSILFYEAVRIIKEMRCRTHGTYPRFAIWENVPGAFSSNKGEDFRAVLQAIGQIKEETLSIPKADKWTKAGAVVANEFSIAWRVLDAQYFGVPQRRKRIFLVADFNGQCAEKILFEPKSLPWDFETSRKSWKEITTGSSEGIRESSHELTVFENHSQDTRYKELGEVAPTVSATYGLGGNNQPFVAHTPKTLKMRSGCAGGGKGALIQEDVSATLGTSNDQTVFIPYGICSKDSNAMKSSNVKSGFYEAETARTVDANGGNPSCNQGGIAVVALQTRKTHPIIYSLDRESFNCGNGFARSPGITTDEVNSTLNAQGPSAVGVPTYSSSRASFFTSAEEELANTLVATDYKGPPLVNDRKTASGKEVFGTLSASMGEKQWLGNQEAFSGDYHILEPEYIVRRLTPTECARLQGFPDDWCSDLETEQPTEGEVEFWVDIFETHRKVMGKTTKQKSRNQIIKWLKFPHSDSAEYKMWGNGVALPCVIYVLSSVAYYAQKKKE